MHIFILFYGESTTLGEEKKSDEVFFSGAKRNHTGVALDDVQLDQVFLLGDSVGQMNTEAAGQMTTGAESLMTTEGHFLE